MGDIINLRRERKRAARRKDAEKADTNRALHGRTKAERAQAEAEAMRFRKQLDGARLEDGDEVIKK